MKASLFLSCMLAENLRCLDQTQRTQNTASSMSDRVTDSLPSHPTLPAREPRQVLRIQWVCITAKEHEAGQCTIFITSRRKSAVCGVIIASLKDASFKHNSLILEKWIKERTVRSFHSYYAQQHQHVLGTSGMLTAHGRVLLLIYFYKI